MPLKTVTLFDANGDPIARYVVKSVADDVLVDASGVVTLSFGDPETQTLVSEDDPLPVVQPGVATAANQATLNGYVDGIETQLTTIDGRVDGLEALLTAISSKLTGAPNVATAQVAVDDTSGGVVVAAARSTRRSVTIVNHGAVDVWIGVSGVTVGTGALLLGTKGSALTIATNAAVRAVTEGDAVTVGVVEVYD